MRPGDPEPQIMDFQTQQWKLFPHLALSFGFHFAAEELQKTYNIISKEVNAGTFQSLPELHALSCGLKVHIVSPSLLFEAHHLAINHFTIYLGYGYF